MESILIFPPGPSVAGSNLQLGTYLMWDPGADYGGKGLINSIESSNALRDGGVFAYRNVGPRRMAFPLLLRDVPGQTLLQTESLLREWTTAGAAVAVQPETVPSGQAVFFDVIDGRWEPDYDGFYNRAGRRKGTLYLDTQPWGYWPTEILLASAASIGRFGQLAVNGGSVIGDAPPLAHVCIAPTVASYYGPTLVVGGNAIWAPDMVALSFGARPSFSPLIAPAAFAAATQTGGVVSPSLAGDKYAPASQAWVFSASGVANPFGWYNLAFSASAIGSALEPAYRGRFRAFAFAKLSVPAATAPWYLIVDAEKFVGTGPLSAMASSNQLATAWGGVPTTNLVSASPGYSMLDLGEITLPPAGSGVQQGDRLRLWGRVPSVPSGAAWQLSFGGLYLLPIDGPAGILTRGLIVPSYSTAGLAATQAALEINGNIAESVEITTGFPASAPIPAPLFRDGQSFYRGLLPRLGASTNQLLFVTGDRLMNVGFDFGGITAQANLEYSQVSVSYRPSFQFLAGL